MRSHENHSEGQGQGKGQTARGGTGAITWPDTGTAGTAGRADNPLSDPGRAPDWTGTARDAVQSVTRSAGGNGIAASRSLALGWFAVGLGAAQLIAPRHLARLIGIRPTRWSSWLLRWFGAREALTGAGILTTGSSSLWLGARVVGDAADLALLTRAMATPRSRALFRKPLYRRGRLAAALAAVLGVSALDVWAFRRSRRSQTQEGRAASPKLAAAITVDRTPSDVYAFWRDVENLPLFMSHLQSVTSSDRIRSHWRAKVPSAASVKLIERMIEWDATIVEDHPEQRIVWKTDSLRGIGSGEVCFEPAPGGGTEVHLTIEGSTLGSPKVVARWLRKIPQQFLANQLRRLKQVMELGEISQSDASVHPGPYPARPSPRARPSPSAPVAEGPGGASEASGRSPVAGNPFKEGGPS